MAKKITENEAEVIEATTVEKIEDAAPQPKHQKAETQQLAPEPETKPEPKKPEPSKTESQVPDHADRILKSFPYYPKLYIDIHGGTYTVDTPPAFRSNATLYTNPYHKP